MHTSATLRRLEDCISVLLQIIARHKVHEKRRGVGGLVTADRLGDAVVLRPITSAISFFSAPSPRLPGITSSVTH